MSTEIGKRIKMARIQAESPSGAPHMKQSELAEAAELAVPAMGMVERGERSLKLAEAVRIARALDVSLDYLAGVKGGAA